MCFMDFILENINDFLLIPHAGKNNIYNIYNIWIYIPYLLHILQIKTKNKMKGFPFPIETK